MVKRDLTYLKDLRDILSDAKMMVVSMKLNAAESSTTRLTGGMEAATSAIDQILKRNSNSSGHDLQIN